MSERQYPEDQIQRAIWQHIKARGKPGLVAFHVPNGFQAGGRRTAKGIAIQAARMKGLGMVPGVSDWVFCWRGRFYALEVKAPGNRPTEAQLDFIQRVNDSGGYATWAAGLDRCLAILEAWGMLKGTSQLGEGAHEPDRLQLDRRAV